MTVLDRILGAKRREIAERKASRPPEELREAARVAPEPRSLRASLAVEGGSVRIIAEVKKASPSKGLIREDFDAAAIARAYERAGAAGISVLTDEDFFEGRLAYLEAIRREVRSPLLRKDFLIDPYQIWEARAAGADAVLLILAALENEELRALGEEASSLGMEVLWEVHDRDELRRLAPLEPSIIGINNRDLRTFEVRLETTRELLAERPGGALVVSESGFSSASEIGMMRGWGVDAFLIGEALMRARDPGEALASLISGAERWAGEP